MNETTKRYKMAQNQAATIHKSIERIRTVAAKAGRELNEDDRQDIKAWEDVLETVGRDIQRENEALEAEYKASKPVPHDVWPGQLRDGFRHDRRPARGVASSDLPRFRALFPNVQLATDDWPDYESFLNTIHAGVSDPRLTAMVEGSGPEGGWLVPTQYAAEMLDAAMENSIVLSHGARVYPMASNKMQVGGFDASTNASGSLFAGIQSQWLGEATAGVVTNPLLRKIELTAKKLALFCSTSNEVAADGLSLDAQLNEGMSLANAWFLDYAFLRGTGAGQPLGVLADPALITVAKESGQDPDTILYENLCNMLGRIHPGCFNNAVWVCSPSCIPQLLQLSQPIGIGGVQIPILKEANGGWSILTRPLVMTEKLPTIGDKGDLILADFSQYAVGVRSQISIEKSAHLLFMSDQVVWRAITRVDGQGRWNKAFTPANGATQSWAVCLEAR